MLAIISTCALTGIDAYSVTVEVDIANGLPGFSLVGLPDSAVKEARERVFAALKNSGFIIPSKKITINLAPGGIRKEGTAFDLPLALGILKASGQIDFPNLDRMLFLGELSLDGSLRPVRGALSAAIHGKKLGLKGLVLPNENKLEAQFVSGLGIFAGANLVEVIEFLKHQNFSMDNRIGNDLSNSPKTESINSIPATSSGVVHSLAPPSLHSTSLSTPKTELDFSEVRGQAFAKRALEVAAAGAHNFLMVGSPGCGKTLLARRVPTIMPQLNDDEALETMRVYSAAGMLKGKVGFIKDRPFRAPHHSISQQALIGGGPWSRPGELSLAHNGLLFLDEFPEFHKDVVESLRQPLEEGSVTISRALQSLTYPCRMMLGAAMNPCPCGFLLDRKRKCLCRLEEINRYRARLSGPLLDRIDIHLELPVLKMSELESPVPAESSEVIQKRVQAAREIQLRRYKELGKEGEFGRIYCNGHLSGIQARNICRLGENQKLLLRKAVESIGLSARAYDRILKVARTIADLDAKEEIDSEHLAEAIHYRSLDRALELFS